MKFLLALLFALFVAFVATAPAAPKDEKEPLVLHAKQHRRFANHLKAYHQQMRKAHKNYVPSYPDDPILTVISIGTPAQTYWVSIESGSEATFVLAKDYPGRNVVADQMYYDPAQSSTSQYVGGYAAFSGNLEALGSAYDDVVGLLGFQTNTTQRFGVVNDIYDPYVTYPQMPDGVVGLSWDPEDAANPNEDSSAIINLFKEFEHFDRYWCQWLTDTTNPHYGREYKMITTFGTCLDAYCAPPTANNTYPLVWLSETRSLAFLVDAFTYNDLTYSGGYAKVDTGVPNILLPYNSFMAVYLDVRPTYDYDYGLYTVDCNEANSLPGWTFTIGGSPYTIPSSAYVTDLLLPNGQCALSAHISDAETTDYVFGYVFHNLWCIKMDIDNQAISIMDVLPPTTKAPVAKN